MPALLKRWWKLAWLAAALAAAPALVAVSGSPERDAWTRYEKYGRFSELGEALIHRAADRGRDVSRHLPLASVLAALGFSHDGGLFSSLESAGFAVAAAVNMVMVLASYSLVPVLLFSLWGVWARSYLNDYHNSVYALFVLLTGVVLMWRARRPSLKRDLALAAVLGAGLLFRSPLAFFPPLLAAVEAASLGRGLRSRWKGLLIVGAAPYLFLLPWTALNWSLHRRLIPFEYGEASCNIVSGALGFPQTIEGNWQALVKDPRVDTSTGKGLLAWAAREALGHPRRYLRAYAARLLYVGGLGRPLLWLLALLPLILQRGRRELRGLALLAAYFVAVYCAMSVQDDYFMPLWPLLALLAGALAHPWLPLLRVRPDRRLYAASRRLLGGLAALALVLSAYVWILCGAYAWALGRGASAGALDGEVARHPKEAWLRFERGRRRLQEARPLKAAEDFEAGLGLEPGRPDMDLQRRWALALGGRPQELPDWKAPENEDADELVLDGHILKAHGLMLLSRKQEERRELDLVLATSKDLVRVRGQGEETQALLARLQAAQKELLLGRIDKLLEKRPAKEALALTRELGLRSSDPAGAGYWIGRASEALASGETGAAREALELALQAAPGVEERRRVALIYQNLKDYARARRLFGELARERPQDAALLGDWGLASYLAGERSAAAEELERSIRLDPRRLSSYLTLASIRLDEKGYAAAAAVLKRGLAQPPGADEALRPLLEDALRQAQRGAAN